MNASSFSSSSKSLNLKSSLCFNHSLSRSKVEGKSKEIPTLIAQIATTK